MTVKRKIITITDDGMVTIPSETKMTIAEIADLLGIYYQTAKKHIRAIEKSGIANGDDSMGGSTEGTAIYPDHYGLEIVIALSFRVQSRKAAIIRSWLFQKTAKPEFSNRLIITNQNSLLN